MVIWLKESKKGFTLIELMVVVAIIGVLVLLGLRTYAPQKERAVNSIAKANAGTVQTILVGYMGNHNILVVSAEADIIAALNGVVAETGTPLERMVNPYNNAAGVYHIDSGVGASVFDVDDPADPAWQGMVSVLLASDNTLLINARGKKGELLFTHPHSLPANKY